MAHKSTKRFTGYSTCFRQWRAVHSHCQFLHGYSLEFIAVFTGELDEKNWVVDFGCFKRNGFKNVMNYWFDHTTIIAADDPDRHHFEKLEKHNLIQLRVLDHVGCEKFAEFVFKILEEQFENENISVESVQCFENQTNSAIYEK